VREHKLEGERNNRGRPNKVLKTEYEDPLEFHSVEFVLFFWRFKLEHQRTNANRSKSKLSFLVLIKFQISAESPKPILESCPPDLISLLGSTDLEVKTYL
jgi:hypothetical protein